MSWQDVLADEATDWLDHGTAVYDDRLARIDRLLSRVPVAHIDEAIGALEDPHA